jgi:hypothetical protein
LSESSSISRLENVAAPGTAIARTTPPAPSASRKGANVLSAKSADPEVRLVGSVLRHRVGVRHALEGKRHVAADDRHHLAHQRLDRVHDELLRGERHLDVHLRELGLPVGAKILVSETLDDLEVPVQARDHQDLLEDLRRLRQRVELTGMHAARHQVVARAFRRGFRQHGRFDLEEILRVEVMPHRKRHAMPQREVALQVRPAQIEIPVAKPEVLVRGGLFGNLERGRARLAQDADLARDDLDLSRRQPGIGRIRRSVLDAPDDRHHELGVQLPRVIRELLARHDLRQPVAVAHIEEHERAKVARAVDPSKQHDVRADVRRAELAARVSTIESA